VIRNFLAFLSNLSVLMHAIITVTFGVPYLEFLRVIFSRKHAVRMLLITFIYAYLFQILIEINNEYKNKKNTYVA
jgi:hypothetical protein